MRKAIRGLSNVDKNNNNKCVVTDLWPESVTTSMPGATNRVEFEKKYLAWSLCEADIKGRFSID